LGKQWPKQKIAHQMEPGQMCFQLESLYRNTRLLGNWKQGSSERRMRRGPVNCKPRDQLLYGMLNQNRLFRNVVLELVLVLVTVPGVEPVPGLGIVLVVVVGQVPHVTGHLSPAGGCLMGKEGTALSHT